MVGVHLTHLLSGGEYEFFARLELGLDDIAVCPRHGIAVAEIEIIMFLSCAHSRGDCVGDETVVGYYSNRFFLSFL